MSLYPQIKQYCDQLVIEFDQIPRERKVILKKIANYLSLHWEQGLTPKLIVICTHNSRRSHLGQLWISMAAAYYQLPPVDSYSGGTEATALYPTVVSALRDTGLKVEKINDSTNPKYLIRWNDEMLAFEAFSKKYQDPPNTKDKFAAVLVCNSADADCPVVFGSDLRISLPYDDPKEADGTPEELGKYIERNRQIARETLWLMNQTKALA